LIYNDQYLFTLGNGNVYDNYTINVNHNGNVAKIINHSCFPDLICLKVLCDHDDGMIPHIMLFVVKDIPKMQEPTYNHHYKIDQVVDSNGNIKNICYCDASNCGGMLYLS
jgi:SET domain-containing protein